MTAHRFSLYRRNVVITGASGGLGCALTRRLTQTYQCRVLGVGRSEKRLRELSDSLGQSVQTFEYRVCDVSDPDDRSQLSEFIRQGGFAADILINNAGMLPPFARLETYSSQELDDAMAVNMEAVLHLTRDFLTIFAEKDGTAIINIASADALCPLAGTSLYSAGKAAVLALSESAREEYRGRIYLPAVCPGFIRTEIMRNQHHTVSPLVDMASMSADKAARIILRRVNAGRSRIVVGADAHLMSAAYRIAPVASLRLFRTLMKRSGLALFSDIS